MLRTGVIGVSVAFGCLVAMEGAHACPPDIASASCIGSAVRTMTGLSSLAAVALAILAAALALGVLWQVRRHQRLAGLLERWATPAQLMNHDVAIVAGLPAPCVAGIVRPRIYCPPDLMERLAVPELCAVLLHERHHQLSHAPARLVILAALATIFGPLGAGRRWIERQRAAIEIAADRYALLAGARRPEVARAMIKLGPGLAGGSLPGYSSATELRLRHLLGEAEPHRGLRYGLIAGPLPACLVLACLLLGLLAQV